MKLNSDPSIHIQKLTIGDEKAPLMVIDNFVEQADDLVSLASKLQFSEDTTLYPGLRCEAPKEYKEFLLKAFQDTFIDYFQLKAKALKFSACQYSIVTTESTRLKLLQRIPHFDSLNSQSLATVHYLFKTDLGGTSFYRHRKTGFEYIDESRKIEYFRSLESENGSGNIPTTGYIYGDTPLFEHIAEQTGVFNRILIYRRNSLHSGSIYDNYITESNPLTGRLSINSFIEPVF